MVTECRAGSPRFRGTMNTTNTKKTILFFVIIVIIVPIVMVSLPARV
jgi:hypothetical protein